MKGRVVIAHGWGGSPREPMHAWMRNKLESRENQVIAPEMPDANHPRIKSWVEKLDNVVSSPDRYTHFIGHSIGCQTVLRYLQTLDKGVKVGKVVLIAPWMYLDENTIAEDGQESVDIAKPWTETPIDWKKIRQHADQFFCIFSDNDPYVPLSNQDIFRKELGATIIVEHNKGHYTETDGISSNKTAIDFILK